MDAIVVSAFPGCGKTWSFRHQMEMNMSIQDLDSSVYDKSDPEWYKKYADDIERDLPNYDFILISQHDEIRKELQERNIDFVTVAPQRSNICKEIYIGRWVLREAPHIKDFDKWLKNMLEHYDEWVGFKNQTKYGAKISIRINYNQHLDEVLDRLFLTK